jgi:hypothetical protein
MSFWFPFTEAEARSAFRWMIPPESIDMAVKTALESSGGWISDNCLILLALESPEAAERARQLQPSLSRRITEAMNDVESFRRRIATAMGLLRENGGR